MSLFLNNARFYPAVGPLLALWNILFSFVAIWADVEDGGGAGGEESSSDEEMGEATVIPLYATSWSHATENPTKVAITIAQDDLERMVGHKAVFWSSLEGNSMDNDAELDNLVRRAFKKTGRVKDDGAFYWEETNHRELLDPKAGLQFRNVGLDCVLFGNAREAALPALNAWCGESIYVCKATEASRGKVLSLARHLRRVTLQASVGWVIGCNMVCLRFSC